MEDYLVKSGVFDYKTLIEDSLLSWNEILLNPAIDDFNKKLIHLFLKPYNLSQLKYFLNSEYFEDPYPVDFKNNHAQISPSLKLIKKEFTKYYVAGFPSWFYVCFPDVAIWTIYGEGNKIINKYLQNKSEEEYIEDNKLKMGILKFLIDSYLAKTKQKLECTKIDMTNDVKSLLLKEIFPNFDKFIIEQREILKVELSKNGSTIIEYKIPIVTFGILMGHIYIGIESNGNNNEIYIDALSSKGYKIKGKRISLSRDVSIEEYNQLVKDLTTFLMTQTNYLRITAGDI